MSSDQYLGYMYKDFRHINLYFYLFIFLLPRLGTQLKHGKTNLLIKPFDKRQDGVGINPVTIKIKPIRRYLQL